jgi:hypothetical protein
MRGGDAPKRIPQQLMAAGALIDREIALDSVAGFWRGITGDGMVFAVARDHAAIVTLVEHFIFDILATLSPFPDNAVRMRQRYSTRYLLLAKHSARKIFLA